METCTERCNLISGNGESGVVLFDAATQDNRVIGNYIGVDINGDTALGNQLGGVAIGGSASNNQIGDSRDGVGCGGFCNLISGNGQSGVLIYGTNSNQNRVYGNFIGTDAQGMVTIPNVQFGIDVNTNVTRHTAGYTQLDKAEIIALSPSDDSLRHHSRIRTAALPL